MDDATRDWIVGLRLTGEGQRLPSRHSEIFFAAPFDVRGAIHLGGLGELMHHCLHPQRAPLVPVNRRVLRFHMLQFALFETTEGALVGRYVLHYADGEKRYILAPEGLRIGERVMSGRSAEIKTGIKPPRQMALEIALESEVDDRRAPAPDDLEQVKPTHPL